MRLDSRAQYAMLRLASLAIVLIIGCNRSYPAHNNWAPAPVIPIPQPPVTPPVPVTYILAPEGLATVSGLVGEKLTLYVKVTANGAPVDNVYVKFENVSGTVYGLGTDTTGTGHWLIGPPGSGIAGAYAIPAYTGSVIVKCSILSGIPSNAIETYFTVIGY